MLHNLIIFFNAYPISMSVECTENHMLVKFTIIIYVNEHQSHYHGAFISVIYHIIHTIREISRQKPFYRLLI